MIPRGYAFLFCVVVVVCLFFLAKLMFIILLFFAVFCSCEFAVYTTCLLPLICFFLCLRFMWTMPRG